MSDSKSQTLSVEEIKACLQGREGQKFHVDLNTGNSFDVTFHDFSAEKPKISVTPHIKYDQSGVEMKEFGKKDIKTFISFDKIVSISSIEDERIDLSVDSSDSDIEGPAPLAPTFKEEAAPKPVDDTKEMEEALEETTEKTEKRPNVTSNSNGLFDEFEVVSSYKSKPKDNRRYKQHNQKPYGNEPNSEDYNYRQREINYRNSGDSNNYPRYSTGPVKSQNGYNPQKNYKQRTDQKAKYADESY